MIPVKSVELPQPEQTLIKQSRETQQPATHPYLLTDDGGVFISFETAQEAFSWIELYAPAAITHVNIAHAMKVGYALTSAQEGEVFELRPFTREEFLAHNPYLS